MTEPVCGAEILQAEVRSIVGASTGKGKNPPPQVDNPLEALLPPTFGKVQRPPRSIPRQSRRRSAGGPGFGEPGVVPSAVGEHQGKLALPPPLPLFATSPSSIFDPKRERRGGFGLTSWGEARIAPPQNDGCVLVRSYDTNKCRWGGIDTELKEVKKISMTIPLQKEFAWSLVKNEESENVHVFFFSPLIWVISYYPWRVYCIGTPAEEDLCDDMRLVRTLFRMRLEIDGSSHLEKCVKPRLFK